MAMWLNYVINDQNAALINFERDDSYITSQSDDIVNWEAIEADIEAAIKKQFPNVDFTFTAIRNQNGMNGLADLKLNTSNEEDIEMELGYIVDELDISNEKYYK